MSPKKIAFGIACSQPDMMVIAGTRSDLDVGGEHNSAAGLDGELGRRLWKKNPHHHSKQKMNRKWHWPLLPAAKLSSPLAVLDTPPGTVAP